jgi:type I restriction enzyme S subunit
MLHRDEFTASGVPVIAVGNLTGMGFTKDGLYFITKQKAEQLSRFEVQAGDVLFARSGATLGKVCVAPEFVDDWRMTGHILRGRLNQSYILPIYAVYALHGDPVVVGQVADNIRGVTRPGFNTSLLESIRLPLPPLNEQKEIVRRVSMLFTFADRIEQRIAATFKQTVFTTQSVLAKGFAGELVETEAELARREGRDYEPASMLLERIAAERAVRLIGKPNRKTTSKTGTPPPLPTVARQRKASRTS